MSLAETPDGIFDEQMDDIERFFLPQYCRTTSQIKVNQARQELFTKENRALENIPLTHAALVQHTRRTVYQAGGIWGNSPVAMPNLPSPSEWGWTQLAKGWIPFWMVLAQAQQMCYELIRCR